MIVVAARAATDDATNATPSVQENSVSNVTDTTPKHTNRLVNETSPYLLQHAHNPVDWYPWGEAAIMRRAIGVMSWSMNRSRTKRLRNC